MQPTQKTVTLNVSLRNNYSWRAESETSAQDDVLFNRKEGQEVTAMIQSISDK